MIYWLLASGAFSVVYLICACAYPGAFIDYGFHLETGSNGK